jgi:hypothetical protein
LYRKTHNEFKNSYLNELQREILSSRYLGKSPLGDEFVETQGFSVVFRRSQRKAVVEAFGYLDTFLTKVLFPSSNAFYINPLVLRKDSRVDTHIDCRLLAKENVRIIPNLVSILYIHVGEALSGGHLLLNAGLDNEITVIPRSNDLLHFPGRMIHKVTELKGPGLRVALVCEQYNLPDPILESFPEFAILRGQDLAPQDLDLAPRVPAL